MSLEQALAQVQEQAGSEIRVGDWLTMTQERIDTFAEATGDAQWIHVDPARAGAESPYGSTVAHGYLVLSLLPQLLGLVAPATPPFPGARLAVNYGLNRVRFPSPVKPGQRIRGRLTIVSGRRIDAGCLEVTRGMTVEIEGQDKPACVAEGIARYYF